MSDNDPQFDSKEFRDFGSKWKFQLVTSSLAYPQSNGKVENVVCTAKQLMRRAKDSSDNYLVLLVYRNTPMQGLDTSLAQRLMCQRTKTMPLTTVCLLKPEVVEQWSKLEANQSRQAKYYNWNAHGLSELSKGDIVRVHLDDAKTSDLRKTEVKAKVNIRSYDVETEDGKKYCQNQVHLCSTKEEFKPYFQAGSVPESGSAESNDTEGTNEPMERDSDTQVTSAAESHPCGHAPLPSNSSTVITRSGRKVKRPQYLKDYVIWGDNSRMNEYNQFQFSSLEVSV